MDYIFSESGIFILAVLAIALITESRRSWAGALSLPAMTILTGIFYFFVLPLLFVLSGEETYFGLGMEWLPTAQVAMALYMIGAAIAFISGRQVLRQHPLSRMPITRLPNSRAYWTMLAVLVLSIAFKFALGDLSFGEQQAGSVDSQVTGLGFLNLAYSSLIALTIYTLVSTRFAPGALLMFVVVIGIFLLAGFRFRMVILCSAAALSWCAYMGFRPKLAVVSVAIVAGLVVLNTIGMTRTYGRGIDLSRVEGRSFQDLLQSVGGEIGPVLTLSHLTQRESDYLLFEPWYIAVTRLIPTAIWPNKPFPDYLRSYPEGFPDPNAIFGGIAGTQHAEFYMQFGWVGLPVLAFGFFMLSIWVIKRLLALSPDARLTGLSIMPALVGFYAQQRGYAFQIICEYIFTLAPLFLIHIGGKRLMRRRSVADAYTARSSNA